MLFIVGLFSINTYRTVFGPYLGISFAITLLTVVLLPNQLPKGMFLCPTTQEQRLQFIKLGIIIKVSLLAIISLISLIITYLALDLPFIYVIIGFIFHLEFTIIYSLNTYSAFHYTRTQAQENQKDFDHYHRDRGERIYGLVTMLSLIFTYVIFMFCEADSLTELKFLIILVILSTLLFTTYMIKYSRKAINSCVDYQIIYGLQTEPDRGV